MANKNSTYFEDFISMVRLSCKAAEYLCDCLKDFHPETLEERRRAMHQIENQEDMIKHEMMRKLVREFVPPIDREDIIQLSNELDNVTDTIEDILIRMFMYNIQEVRSEALIFADVIKRCCQALEIAITEFPSFKNSASLNQALIDVNTLEEEGDAIYIDGVHRLYKEGGNPVEIVAWSEIFDRLEDCCDACEHVADALETIVMKNS